MGFWTTYIGVSPRLTYMLVFENQADRERAWAAYHTDPAWPAVEEGLYPNGRPLIIGTESCLMKRHRVLRLAVSVVGRGCQIPGREKRVSFGQ